MGQLLEAVVVYLGPDDLHHVRPADAPTFRPHWEVDLQPGEVVVDAIAGLGLSPFLVHSTSWRMEGGRVVLTYLVAIEPPGDLAAGLLDTQVARSELARGSAMGRAPLDVEVAQILEHGLRHFAWLVRDDPGVHEALPEWVEALASYEPEPFRAFDGPPNR